MRNIKKLLFIFSIFGFYTSYGQNDSITNNKSKIVSPWTRSGNLSIGGTNFSFNGRRKDFNLNIVENINYKIAYNKNKVKQVHLFQQNFSLSKHGTDNYHIEIDNLLYQYRLEIDYNKNNHYGFVVNLFTHSYRGTSSGSVKDTSIISNFFSPAIITEGITYGYNNDKGIHVTYSPLSGKHTLVFNKNVDPTHWGLDKGKRANHELGTFLTVGVENLQILKNLTLSTDVLFFSNYLKDFGDIAVTSSSKLQVLLTKWLSIDHTMILNHDKDHNVQIAEDLVANNGATLVYTGSKWQISNLVYLSINFNFDLIKKKKQIQRGL